jgi:hypothetical protein
MGTNVILGLVFTVFSSYSQCLTSKHINIANKVFEGNLKSNDFDGNLFLTIDTVNAWSLSVPSEYSEFSESSELTKSFYKAMNSINVVGRFFNYYESFNNSLYNSPLHLMFIVNKRIVKPSILVMLNQMTKLNDLTNKSISVAVN